MAAENHWKILYPDKEKDLDLLSEDQVRTIYSDRYSPQYNSTVTKGIGDYLSSRDASTIQLHSGFDKRSYRLAGVDYDSDKICLKIGLSSYLDYLAFRSDSRLIDSVRLNSEDLTSHLPNVVGNIGVLVTKDRQSVGVVRSKDVSTYKGYLDFPGGHPEPVKVDIKERRLGQENFDLSAAINHELFDAVKREIIEDLGIDNAALGEPFLFSIILNKEDVMKPDMAFIIGTSLTARDILECFLTRTPSPIEVDKLVFFDLQDSRNHLTGYRLTPIMDGALTILGRNSIEMIMKHF